MLPQRSPPQDGGAVQPGQRFHCFKNHCHLRKFRDELKLKHIPQRADFKELVLDKLVERLNSSVFVFTFVRWMLCVYAQRVATGGPTKVERLIFYQTAFHVDLVVEALKCQRFVLTEDFLAWLNSIKVLKVLHLFHSKLVFNTLLNIHAVFSRPACVPRQCQTCGFAADGSNEASSSSLTNSAPSVLSCGGSG